jgi:hypothetical protein
VVVVAPSDAVDRGVALTAWQRIELLPEYDERRVERFISALARRYNHGWADGASDCLNGGARAGDSRARRASAITTVHRRRRVEPTMPVALIRRTSPDDERAQRLSDRRPLLGRDIPA